MTAFGKPTTYTPIVPWWEKPPPTAQQLQNAVGVQQFGRPNRHNIFEAQWRNITTPPSAAPTNAVQATGILDPLWSAWGGLVGQVATATGQDPATVGTVLEVGAGVAVAYGLYRTMRG